MKVGDVVISKTGGQKMVIIEDQGVNEFGHWFTCSIMTNGEQKLVDCLETMLSVVEE